MIVTRIVFSHRLNPGKYAALEEQAARLGVLRSEVWQRYGSIHGVGLTDRAIRDGWLQEPRGFPVLANAWKETLRDAKADIAMTMEAAKVKARQALRRHTDDAQERQRLYTALKANRFAQDRYLARVMRKYWVRGHNHTHNQIIVRSDNYTTFQQGVMAEALDHVSQRRGSTLVLVNPAYTSQMDSRNGCLLGQRQGDAFYCFDGVVLPADENAAQNVLARLHDSEIHRWTPFQKVKSLLQARTERHRLGLLNLDSSCSSARVLSTESEMPKQLWLSF